LGFGEVLITSPREKNTVKKYSQGEMLHLEAKQSRGKLLPHSDLGGGVFLGEIPHSKKRDFFLWTWNVRSLYTAGSLAAAARKLARYKLDFVGLQEVRWNKRGTVRAGTVIFSMEKEMKIISCEQEFLHKRIASAVKRVEFVSDRMSYIVLRGRWCNIIVLNLHAPSEEKSDELKDIFMRN